MKRAWLVNLLLIVGVAGLALYAIYRPKPADNKPKHKLSQLAASAVQRIQIEQRNGPVIELQKHGESWFLTAPLEARADRSQIDRLLDVLHAGSSDKLPAEELGRYDLDNPRLKLRFGDETIAFGMTNPVTQEQYALAGGAVYLVSTYFASSAPAAPDRLLTHALLREGEKPVGFEFKQFRVTQKEGKWSVEPAPANEQEAPSADELNRWVDEWRFASSLVTRPAGQRKPVEHIRVRLSDGNEVSFGVLQKDPELILLRHDEKLEFQLSAENGRRLLARPVASPAPAPATSGVKAP
jgi:hypothetical protein